MAKKNLNTLKIRKADDKDIATLSELAKNTYSDAFGHSFLPSDLAAHLENNLSPSNFRQILAKDTVLIAQMDEQMVGFVQFGLANHCYLEADSDNDWALHKFYVLAEFQNKGIGSLLMDAVLEQLNQAGNGRIFLDVWEHNPSAQRFYQRVGFEVIGKLNFEVESGAETSLDLIMMHSILRE